MDPVAVDRLHPAVKESYKTNTWIIALTNIRGFHEIINEPSHKNGALVLEIHHWTSNTVLYLYFYIYVYLKLQ